MSSPTPPSPADQTNVKRMLLLFAIIALVGVLMFAFSVILGLFVLVVAEVFFAIAYRRFSKVARGKRADP